MDVNKLINIIPSDSVKKRAGIKYVFADSDPDPEIVSMVEWCGFMYIATKKGVYRIEDDTMVRLRIVDKGYR